MIGKAHRETEKLVIDPLYSSEKFLPEKPSPPPGQWLYFPYDREAFLLEKMVREKDEAKLKVGYTQFRKTPAEKAFFQCDVVKGENLSFKATGSVQVFLNGKKILEKSERKEKYTFLIPENGKLVILLYCSDITCNIPSLFAEENFQRWKISSDGISYISPVNHSPLYDGNAPHFAQQEKVMLLGEKLTQNVWDAKRELFAYIHISCNEQSRPFLYMGESIAEMKNRKGEDEEQTRELIRLAPGKWRSKVLLAFRYVQIENAPEAEIHFEAEFQSLCYRGALFVEGRETWNRIWLQSCYTLRLCMKNFLLDGIKRDRLPWAGDLAVSLLGNAFSFAEKDIVKDTLCVLGAVSIKEAHVNSIIDYSLWFLINHEYFQLYYSDREFLLQEYPRIKETLEILLDSRDENGFLAADPRKVWLFIDWVNGEKFTALQVIFFRALLAGKFLALLAGEKDFAARMEKEAYILAGKIKECAYDAEKGLFTAAPGKKEYTRHPNLLAVDFGLVSGEEAEKIARHLAGNELPKVGTPYMSVFEVMALFKGGMTKEAFEKFDAIWGGMLKEGATTFWEGFDPDHKGEEHYVFYGRPYGKSLCHAWGAGPAFLLPQMLFGIEVIECSWKKFSLSPMPGVTGSIEIPTPFGNIQIECVDGVITYLSCPEECERV
ncbi:MAG: hypothetical protein J6S53_04835 [Lentisphaeria bacterium]|nr:hypothetical protein [Lentisphaeria bacterium]